MRTVGERLAPLPDDVCAGRRAGRISPSRSAILPRSATTSPLYSRTAFAAMVKAVRHSYQCLAQGKIDPFIGRGERREGNEGGHGKATGLERLLEIERRTMKELGRCVRGRPGTCDVRR